MNKSALSIAAAGAISLMVSAAAPAQQPPDSVQTGLDNNIAMGDFALQSLTADPSNQGAYGASNTAAGTFSMSLTTTGSNNVAFGTNALSQNTTGSNNSALGTNAMSYNQGNDNTATGFNALEGPFAGGVTGSQNTATGSNSLYTNFTGTDNVASGFNSMLTNSTGSNNSAFGTAALQNNISASDNAAFGYAALYTNTTGKDNVAIGYSSLYANTRGSNNIAIGYQAGMNITTGSDNIDIGASPRANEAGVIRIGTDGSQKTTYIAGISTEKVTGAAVYVTAAGQLGVLASSARYKTKVETLGDDSKLQGLRPVSFHLKSDPQGAVQYGLIAEEVDKVYPELVIRDAQGVIQGVRYDELAPLLLKRVQDQEKWRQAQDERQNRLETQLALLMKQNEALQAAMLRVQSSSERIAMR